MASPFPPFPLPDGYLLLEDCPVCWVGPPSDRIPEKNSWIDVELRHHTHKSNTPPKEVAACHCCDLVLQCEQHADESAVVYMDMARTIYPFQGTLGQPQQPCVVCKRQQQRSDPALAVGLVLAGQECSRIVHMQVLLRSCCDDGINHQVRCDLVLQIAFPVLQATRESILPKKKRNKLLGSALQLLLVLIENDWDELERRKQELIQRCDESKARNGRQNVTFFPSRFSLEEVYKRINHRQISRKRKQPRKISPNASSLVALPLEILTESLAPFFDAPTLALLRATCPHLHESLRAVVPGLRQLRLYQHQIESLQWMRNRELPQREYCRWNRSWSGGATATLRDGTVVDTTTGMVLPERPLLKRNVARGGLLCDDPGLGKTITVLSLVLQTSPAGSDLHCEASAALQKTSGEEKDNDDTKDDDNEDSIFREYWLENVVHEYRVPPLLKLLNDLNRHAPLPRPCHEMFRSLKQAIETNRLGADFGEFEETVQKSIREYGDDATTINFLLAKFQALLTDFKASQKRSARKSFSNASSKPNSRVAAMIEEKARLRYLSSLVPTNATLIVIPSVLMDHWKSQIERHVDFGYWTSRYPLVFEYLPGDRGMTVDRATIQCELDKTHDAVIFLDRGGTRPLPPARFLAKFRIVITSTSRFQNEWKKGSFQQELDGESDVRVSYANLATKTDSTECCELLKVHWSRMIVDEGHSMGNDKTNATIQFASWVCAKRRWAMTGTPTKQSSAQIGQLNRLMSFLEHEFFTPRLNGNIYWKKQIAGGWRSGEIAAFFRIYHVLRLLMKRHTKLDIVELPPPLFSHSKVPMSFTECTTYNTFVSSVHTNLIMTSMEGAKTSGAQDSLLHRSQVKSARSTLQSIRRVCTGFSRAVPTLADGKYAEFLENAKGSGLKELALTNVSTYVKNTLNEKLATCSFCNIELSILILMSCCGGLICTECMDNRTRACYLCESAFDVDDLQRFQPGFIISWRLERNVQPHSPDQDIQQQTSLAGPSSSPTRISGPPVRPPKKRRKTRRLGDGHTCEYDCFSADGVCDLCLTEHQHCNLLNEKSRCKICYRIAEACPTEESKSAYIIDKLLKLNDAQCCRVKLVGPLALPENQVRPLKVIVFSQFRAALNLVGDRLLRRFGTACIAEYFGKHRRDELHKFTHSRECFCLLLTKDGGEGLDLSFVTNIFFLEEIYDKSVQHQAVARAWRMGATQSVHVETLVAKGSVEETMMKQSQSSDNDDTAVVTTSADQQRLKSLLQSLTFVTDFHSFSVSPNQSAQVGNKSSPERAPRETDNRKRKCSDFELATSIRPKRKIRFADQTTIDQPS